MIHEQRHLLDWLTWLCAGIAAVSLAQTALIVTIVSGFVGIILGGIRLHDRLKYGPRRD